MDDRKRQSFLMVIRLEKLEHAGAGGLPRQNFPRLEHDIGKFDDAGLVLAFGKHSLEIVEGDIEVEPVPGNDIPAALRIDAEEKAPAMELLLEQNLNSSKIAQLLICLPQLPADTMHSGPPPRHIS